jgi:undecaprenyl-phosphate 4-deoxy-4-formamido-L-arabinose transferase
MDHPYLSIVVAVCNDEYNLIPFMERLYPVLQGMAKPFEIVFIDDGSQDRSTDILGHMAQTYAGVKTIELDGNFGRQMAILAAFRKSLGRIVITLGADLRDPPEEIPRLVAEVERGRDLVGVSRQKRGGSVFGRLVSHVMGITASRMTGIHMSDPGSALRAYHRHVIDSVNNCREITTSVPALAYSFCVNPGEIRGFHSERGAGEGRPLISELLRSTIDLITEFSVLPLRLLTLAGMAVALFSVAFALFLLFWRIFVGVELEGIMILFAIQFLFTGVAIMGLGIIGEYVAKIYQEVRRRPRFVVKNSHGFQEE